jgi:DNA-directed RNA polymerase subunit alpha
MSAGGEMATAWQGFYKPKKLNYDKKKMSGNYGKFIAEPFERGFGTTIGNALRRHLLSSIQGSAITAVKFEGVHHEFSTLSGVLEDVSDIILNLKELVVVKHVDHPVSVRIDAKGPCEVRGSDIETGSDVEIVNPDHRIATLVDKGAALNMEMIVETGRGYSPAERNVREDMDISMIPIDAVFSPIRKVNFEVEKTRVGQDSDYDKLILEVWTNGAIRPENALALSAKILKEHLQIFINFDETPELASPSPDENKMKVATNLQKSVDELELSVRSYNCLKNANIRTIAELVQKTDAEMLKTRNFGRKSLNEIKKILEEMGLSLGMNIDEYLQKESANSLSVETE